MQKKHIFLFLILVIIDQLSKCLFTSLIALHKKVYLIPNFLAFTNERNQGAAWGFYHGSLKIFTLATLAMIIILFIFYHYVKEKDTLTRCGITCMIAGSFANILDRLLFRSVRDFIFINIKALHSPIFNIADIILWIGIGMIIYSIFQDEKHDWQQKSSESEH